MAEIGEEMGLIKLYHGTGVSKLEQIQLHGITPRSVSKTEGNKSKTIATRSGYRRLTGQEDAVYLSDDSDPWHWAANVVGDDGPGLILEVAARELRPELFAADEDFLSVLHPGKTRAELAKRARDD